MNITLSPPVADLNSIEAEAVCEIIRNGLLYHIGFDLCTPQWISYIDNGFVSHGLMVVDRWDAEKVQTQIEALLTGADQLKGVNDKVSYLEKWCRWCTISDSQQSDAEREPAPRAP